MVLSSVGEVLLAACRSSAMGLEFRCGAVPVPTMLGVQSQHGGDGWLKRDLSNTQEGLAVPLKVGAQVLLKRPLFV